MTTSTFGPEYLGQLINQLIIAYFQGILKAIEILLPPFLKTFLSPLIPTIVTAAILLVATIVFVGMTYGRARRSNGLEPPTNRLMGSFSYLIVHTVVIIICWKIWGIDMLDKSIFYMLHLIAFMLVRIILLSARVWVY